MDYVGVNIRSVMQPDRNIFCGDIILDNFNTAIRDYFRIF